MFFLNNLKWTRDRFGKWSFKYGPKYLKNFKNNYFFLNNLNIWVALENMVQWLFRLILSYKSWVHMMICIYLYRIVCYYDQNTEIGKKWRFFWKFRNVSESSDNFNILTRIDLMINWGSISKEFGDSLILLVLTV